MSLRLRLASPHDLQESQVGEEVGRSGGQVGMAAAVPAKSHALAQCWRRKEYPVAQPPPTAPTLRTSS